jgi:hypothetical protein
VSQRRGLTQLSDEHSASTKKLIEAHKAEHRHHYVSPFEENEVAKSPSPYILGFGYDNVGQGAVFSCDVSVSNPTEMGVGPLYVQLWIAAGVANPIGDLTPLSPDPRLDSPAQPDVTGLNLNPHSIGNVNPTLSIPAAMEKGTYFFCLCLLKRTSTDGLHVLDRVIQPFQIV